MRAPLLKLALVGVIVAAAGCDVDQSFAFPEVVDGVAGVQHLGDLAPAPVPPEDVLPEEMFSYYGDYVLYGEVGPTGTPEYGGVTFDFLGNGGDICVWIDPEAVAWNQSVSPTAPIEAFSWPDNVYDDGDLDVKAGLSVYYTGSPGERIGSFEVLYEDQLGVSVPITLFECTITSDFFAGGASYAGRAVPEFCTISNTIENVSYTVLLESFALPQDDDRLGYGLLLVEGNCDQFLNSFELDAAASVLQECIVLGESIKPGSEQGADAAAAGLPSPTWLGTEKPSWEGSEDVELAFCFGSMRDLCRAEAREVALGGPACSEYNDPQGSEDVRRCYCGDILDTPSGGAF
jgi:hypothetical protein